MPWMNEFMNEQSSHHASGVSRRILLILSFSVVLQSLKEQHNDHNLRKKKSQWKESSESGREGCFMGSLLLMIVSSQERLS